MQFSSFYMEFNNMICYIIKAGFLYILHVFEQLIIINFIVYIIISILLRIMQTSLHLLHINKQNSIIMKSKNLVVGMAVIALAFTSCKDEKETQAEKTVDTYVVYVDSLGTISSDDAKANWEAIDASYQMRSAEAEAALENLKDREKAQARIEASRAKYEEMKAKYQAELDAQAKMAATPNPKAKLRTILFKSGNMGEDMNFDWVNKDNILKVYDEFFQAYKDNKGDFSREDYDEIKLMYEALDSRKNTVEKEGLSSSDNGKIASIKFKFGPMFKMNRMGAKSSENTEAKE